MHTPCVWGRGNSEPVEEREERSKNISIQRGKGKGTRELHNGK